MVKFVVVDKAPESLRDGECVIEMPTFMEEINASCNTLNARKHTSASHLRSIANLIAINYDREFDALRHLKPHAFEGIAFNSKEELSRIVLNMLEANRPQIFDKYLESKIKTRPFGSRLIYFVGPFEKSSVFFASGIEQLKEKDIEAHLGLKPKKIVGRPALSKEDVANVAASSEQKDS